MTPLQPIVCRHFVDKPCALAFAMSCAHHRLVMDDGEINKKGDKYLKKTEILFLHKGRILDT